MKQVLLTKVTSKNNGYMTQHNNFLIENKKPYQSALADKISDIIYKLSTLGAYNLPSTSCAFNKHLTS